MTKAELQKKIARLESLNDHLLSELSYVHELMCLIGFSDGIKTVKATAQEMLRQGISLDDDVEA